ncbi:hypothetical protein AB0P07_25295 [Streptomyces sp. NPDC085944]|uniref:hypothetical protein n=1 Tax=Streptomyces sp. NPDC085944 TaxID=3154962 RepID=UPI0034280A6F
MLARASRSASGHRVCGRTVPLLGLAPVAFGPVAVLVRRPQPLLVGGHRLLDSGEFVVGRAQRLLGVRLFRACVVQVPLGTLGLPFGPREFLQPGARQPKARR